MSVIGIVPAAGRSTRIGGGPKPLLDTGAGTFLERVIAALREGGADRIVVGVRADPGPVAAVARRSGAEVLVPDDVEEGPVATVRAALRSPHGEAPAEAALLLPADFPLVRGRTVAALVDRWRSGGESLLLPRHGGRTGHPALFAGPLLEELLDPALPEGARTVVERHREGAVEVEVDDPGIHVDVDTLPEYRRLFPEAYRKRFQKW